MIGQTRFLKNKHKAWFYLAPAVAVILFLVGYGMWSAVVQSIQTVDGNWTLGFYKELIRSDSFVTSIQFTLWVTLISTVLSLLIGLLLTRILYRLFQQSSVKILVWIPILIPHFVAGYLVYLFLSQSGLLSSFLFQAGLISDRSMFPVLVQDTRGIGIILTYVWKEVPFVILMLLPVYYEIDHRYSEVVRTLGGSKWDEFKTVEWPWLLPILVEIAIILFAFVATAFEVPYLLGVTRPEMLPVHAFDWFYDGDWSKRPLAFAAMIIPGIISLLLAGISFKLIQKHRLRLIKGRVR
ncbi:ABC transporter permease [Guptibacillus algicola]|uniref:ABC transporter permease n=1 Tax=Guptibacillus algicola TaxID=225844 RepID=UPI001CD469C2|nr:ABC transporter permease subunit [Alkalihalobacillus algicola]MCA0985888.1 ABC transporter permease subunit [Alkalihalobacillus algicola]